MSSKVAAVNAIPVGSRVVEGHPARENEGLSRRHHRIKELLSFVTLGILIRPGFAIDVVQQPWITVFDHTHFLYSLACLIF